VLRQSIRIMSSSGETLSDLKRACMRTVPAGFFHALVRVFSWPPLADRRSGADQAACEALSWRPGSSNGSEGRYQGRSPFAQFRYW
jgi:hypothetical protein